MLPLPDRTEARDDARIIKVEVISAVKKVFLSRLQLYTLDDSVTDSLMSLFNLKTEIDSIHFQITIDQGLVQRT